MSFSAAERRGSSCYAFQLKLHVLFRSKVYPRDGLSCFPTLKQSSDTFICDLLIIRLIVRRECGTDPTILSIILWGAEI